MAKLLDLPFELLTMILKWLQFEELASLTRTSRALEDLASSNLRGLDAICWAARYGQLGILRKALKTSDVDLSDGEEDADYNTPLYYATQCFDGSVEQVIHLLLSAGAGINNAGRQNSSPLEIACSCQNFRVAAVLLEAGAMVENDLLQNCVAKIKAKSAGGSVPDKLVSKYGQLQKKVISEVVQKIGSHINDNGGDRRETALMRAAREGDLSTVKLLLELGAAVDARGGTRRTALMVAANLEKLDLVKVLLAAGAEVNLTDMNGSRAIYYVDPRKVAHKTKCRDIWALLLKAGSNITAQDWPWSSNLRRCRCSLFELAVYEAWQGRGLALDLIKKYSKKIDFGKVTDADRLIQEADHFLQSTEYSTASKFEEVTKALESLYAITTE